MSICTPQHFKYIPVTNITPGRLIVRPYDYTSPRHRFFMLISSKENGNGVALAYTNTLLAMSPLKLNSLNVSCESVWHTCRNP